MLIYALPHSHHDLGYTDLQANVEEKQIRNITRGIELARKTAGYPEGSRFVWNLEVLWGADLYMQRGSEAAKAELIDAVQKGWIGINGSYLQTDWRRSVVPKSCCSSSTIPGNSEEHAT